MDNFSYAAFAFVMLAALTTAGCANTSTSSNTAQTQVEISASEDSEDTEEDDSEDETSLAADRETSTVQEETAIPETSTMETSSAVSAESAIEESTSADAAEDIDTGDPDSAEEIASGTVTTVVAEDFKENSGYEFYECTESGAYQFTSLESDGVTWEVYVLDEEFDDALRYISHAYDPVLTGDGTIDVQAGQYIYIYCGCNAFTGEEAPANCQYCFQRCGDCSQGAQDSEDSQDSEHHEDEHE